MRRTDDGNDQESIVTIDAAVLPKAPIAQSEGDARRWLALPILLTGALLPPLDFTVVNLALPSIRQDLGATPSELQFVISAYAATYAVFLITGGRLGDWLGRKRLFTLGIAGFTLASVLCGMARSPIILIAGRILQALTATAMAPQVLASIRVLFPPAEHGRALGLYSAVFGLSNIVGQILGGVLVSSHPFGFTWQAIFLINVPIGLAAFIGSLLFLGDSWAEHAQKLDIGGVVLLSATLGLLIYPLVEGRESGWPAWIIIMLVVSPAALIAFLLFELRLMRRGGSPLVDLSLFRESGFAIGVAMALVYYMMASFYLTSSIYLQGGLGLTPFDAGLRMLPIGVGYFLSSFASAGIMQRLGPRGLTLGFAIQVLGLGAVTLAVTGVMAGWFGIGLFVAGAGFGIVMPSAIKAVISGIDQRHAGLASGIVMSTFQIGSAVGIAIVGGVFFNVLRDGQGLTSYSHAFSAATGCNVALMALGGVLSLWLPGHSRATKVR
jgi:EmrB/QacA subfamily drug resistance transporter